MEARVEAKMITATLLLTVLTLCQSRYAGKLTVTESEYPSYNIIDPDGPGTYAFGYEIDDAASGNKQFRNEERLRNGTVQGSYGLVLPDGTISITKYVADENGYRSKTENKNPRPSFVSIFDSHERPSSANTDPPAVASAILSPHQLINGTIEPTKMEVVNPRGITDELSDDSLVEALYGFRSHNHDIEFDEDSESSDEDSEENSEESSDEDEDDVAWEQDHDDHEVWEDESDYDHIKYVKEIGEWKEVDNREWEQDEDEEGEEEEEWVEHNFRKNGKWEEVVEEVEDEGADEDEWEDFDNDDDDERDENNGDGSENEDWEEWTEEKK